MFTAEYVREKKKSAGRLGRTTLLLAFLFALLQFFFVGRHDRLANSYEKIYLQFAIDKASPLPCYKISPYAYTKQGADMPVYITYTRRACLSFVAQRTKNVDLCNEIENTFRLKFLIPVFQRSGKGSPRNCSDAVLAGKDSSEGFGPELDADLKKILKEMGYGPRFKALKKDKEIGDDLRKAYAKLRKKSDFLQRVGVLPSF